MGIINKLAEKLNIHESSITSYLIQAPNKYKIYKIPKRTHGFRIIAQPAKELKNIQRAFLAIHDFPIHSCAYAYKAGISIKENAQVHSKNSYLLKMDLENFFNTITPNLFWEVWNTKFPSLSPIEKSWFERIIFWRPSKKSNGKLILSIGAPTSPTISNFCMLDFDEYIQNVCREMGVTYSRYADDLTFSTNEKNKLQSIPSIIELALKKIFHDRLTINRNKTVFSSKAHNRHVTGLTITNDGKISIGRERKRIIKHLVHFYMLGKLSNDEIKRLRGFLAFAHHIEPEFIKSLLNKYSIHVIREISTGDDPNEK